MKYLPHIALPVLMLGLLALAMVLPKFVQPEGEEVPSSKAEYGNPVQPIQMLPEYEPKESDSHSKLFADNGSEAAVVNVGPAPDYDKMLKPFLAMLEVGNLDGAEKVLKSIGTKIPSGMKAGLKYSLDSARESEKVMAIAKAETAKAAHATKEAEKIAKMSAQKTVSVASVNAENQVTVAALNKARAETERMEKARKSVEERLNKLQNESAAKIQSSINELNKATQAARFAAQQAEKSALETAKLRAVFESTSPGALPRSTAVSVAKTTVAAPIVPLPGGGSVQFGFNSSVLPSSSSNILKTVTGQLAENSKLGIQLRGYSDSVGNAEYNAILSKARSQKVMDRLVELGISKDRVDLLPFGSSQSPRGRSANHRRVDLIFYEL